MMNDDVYFVTSLMLLPFDQQQGLATANTFIQHTHTHINTHMQARYLGASLRLAEESHLWARYCGSKTILTLNCPALQRSGMTHAHRYLLCNTCMLDVGGKAL
jgi:hypothetical protein